MRIVLSFSLLLTSAIFAQSALAQSWGQLKSAAIDAQASKRYTEASEYWQKTLDACEDKSGPRFIQSLAGQASCYVDQNKCAEAELSYKKILELSNLASISDDAKSALLNYASLLHKLQRDNEASELEKKYQLKQESSVNPLATPAKNPKAEHEDAVKNWQSLSTAAAKELEQKHDLRAEQLLKQSLLAAEKSGDNQLTADSLNRLILLFYSQNKFQLAEPYYQRSLTISCKINGAKSKAYAKALMGHGQLLRKLNRKAEAMSQEAKADAILSNDSGSGGSPSASTNGNDPSATRHGSVLQRAGAAQSGFNRDTNDALNEN